MDPATPRRRKVDRGWRWLVRDNAYRDAWLLVITGLVLWSLISIQNERWNNVFHGCQGANERYLGTLRVIDDSLKNATPAERRLAKDRQAVTLKFIAALAPPHFDKRRDRTHPHGHSTCHAFADGQVSRWP